MNTNIQNQTELVHVNGSSIHIHNRSVLWHVFASLIAFSIIGFSAYNQAWSFLIVFIIAAALYAYILHKPIPQVELSVLSNGIRYNGKEYSFSECTEFWVIDHHYDCELHIRLIHALKDDLRIFIGIENTKLIRTELAKHIPENGQKHERLFDYLTRLLKL